MTLAEVLPSAVARLGLDGFADTLGLTDRIGEVRRIAVVLVDGLGHRLLDRAAPHAPFLADVLAGRAGSLDELRAPFPSTTPTSLVTLGTGVAPGQHGILGFTLNVPGTDRVLTHIVWRDDPPPDRWQPVPTVFERAAAAGLASTVVLPGMFEGSGLTRAAYRGARFAALAKGEDTAARLLTELGSRPGLVFGYTAAVDTAAHVFGIASPQWANAVAKVDGLLQRIVAGLPDDAALLVTADHGGLDIAPGGRLDIAADPRLADGVRIVAGEPRVRYLHTRPGAEADVAAAWRAVLGARARVLLREDAIADGLFGPVEAEHVTRIGDVVVICTDTETVVLATDREPPEVARLIGFHGSTTDEERAIPLICVRGGSVA
jgi:type I phosphodiesterase/nucleotide pyrophosphatase